MIKPNINIVIADDHELFRDGLKLMLNSFENITICGEAENGLKLLEVVENTKPDVVITDINMPEVDGIEATKQLSALHPAIGVIALSMYDDDDLIIDMLEAGASGYLLKNAHKDEVIAAIETVSRGKPYHCENTSKKLLQLIKTSKYNPYQSKPKSIFDEKETEIIRLICQQRTTKEIAEKIFLSPRTIEGIRQRIMEKMDVANTVGIAIYAIKNKLVNL